MSQDAINMLPAVLLGIMVALTLFLLPHLNDERQNRPDEGEGRETKGEGQEHSTSYSGERND